MTNKLEYSWVYVYHSNKRCCCSLHVCAPDKKKYFSRHRHAQVKSHNL